VRYFRAFVLLKTHKPEDAATEIEPLLRKHPDSFRYNHLMAQILLKMNRVAGALGHLRHCLALYPEAVETQALLGVALNLQGEYEEAGLFLRRALVRNPADRRSLLWLVDTGLKSADTAAAADFAWRFLEGLPADQIREAVDRTLKDGYMPETSGAHLKNWLALQARPLAFRQSEDLR
jgi:predicted Zn-dependent protease